MIDCSKTENYLKERARMTKATAAHGINCKKCALSKSNNGLGVPCGELEEEHIKDAIKIIQKWSDSHPRETLLQHMLKHFPNMELDGHGTPKSICPSDIGYKDDCTISGLYSEADYNKCAACWAQPYEEATQADEEGGECYTAAQAWALDNGI